MIPKGGIGAGESAGNAAVRELEEETGLALGHAPAFLCRVRQAGGKIVEVFAAEGEFDPDDLVSMEFEMQWPSKTGGVRRFPEVDAARWMPLDEARRMMLPSQLPMLDALAERLSKPKAGSGPR
jgi:predicted NUDIX family NTP pyrophosphohydrolase